MFRSTYRSRRHRNVQAHEEQQAPSQPFFTKAAQHTVQQKPENSFFQAKLSVNQPDDKYEKEADAVASAVVNNQTTTPVAQKKEISNIQRLSTPMEEEKLGTNDARMLRDKEIQEKPEVQRACSDCEKEKKKAVQRVAAPKEEKKEEETIQQKAEGNSATASSSLSSRIESSGGKGKSLSQGTLHEMQSSFGVDFGNVNIHTDTEAVQMNKELNAQAFTHGRDIYFNNGKYNPETSGGKQLLAHELTHVVQQGEDKKIQRQKSRKEPWITKVLVNLSPPQSASLEWAGTAPADATGSDSFTVSTGKGYSNPGDDPGTCLRSCCSNAETQCDSPYNNPGKTGACCTYVGKGFWTGTAVTEHNGWKWWTPIQPYYSKRAIALHQHDTVTGQPIGHGCVRMDEANAKRIYDYSVVGYTKVEISGRASPVECDETQKCEGAKTKAVQGESTGSGMESPEGSNP